METQRELCGQVHIKCRALDAHILASTGIGRIPAEGQVGKGWPDGS